MATVSRLLATVASLVVAATAAAAAQTLEPEWSRPVGGKTRFVGVEEYGRCSVFVDNGAIQVVNPNGNIEWSWAFARLGKYINPRRVAVSSACDAVAFVGDASYKYVWIVDRAGKSASVKFVATPADVAFDRTGRYVAVGTYGGSMSYYTVNGELQWQRDTQAPIVNDIEFADDGQRIVFKGWAGVGVVSTAGQVEWSVSATQLAASRDLRTLVISSEPNDGPGRPVFVVADERRRALWDGESGLGGLVSANGERVLIDLLDGGPMLATRDRVVIHQYADYYTPIALSADGAFAWMLRREGSVDCVNEAGDVLASIQTIARREGVKVSRDFGQVLVVSEKDLHPVSVDRYVVPASCRP